MRFNNYRIYFRTHKNIDPFSMYLYNNVPGYKDEYRLDDGTLLSGSYIYFMCVPTDK